MPARGSGYTTQSAAGGLSLPEFIPAIAFICCCGLPQQCDGSLGCRRHERLLLVVVVLQRRQQQRGHVELQLRQREPTERGQPSYRARRALRPASAGYFRCRPNHADTTAPYDPEWQGPRFQPERSVDSAIRWRCPGPRARKRRQLYIPAYCGVAALRGAPSRQTFQRLLLTLKLRATATVRREP